DLGQLESLAVFAAEEGVGIVVGVAVLVGDLLLGGVPIELAADLHGDVAEVTDEGRSVAGLDVADATIARLDAGEEVLDVRPVLVGAAALLRGGAVLAVPATALALGEDLEAAAVEIERRIRAVELHAVAGV